MSNNDEMLTTAQAAKILGVTPRRVIALINQHNRAATRQAIAKGYVAKWVGRKPGRDWLLTRAEVELIRPRESAGRPPLKPRGETMKNHWVQVRVDHGELVADTEGGTDLYLTTIREWYSPDGKAWERQPDCYEVFTGGTTDPISRHGGDSAPCTLGEALANYDYPGLDIDRYVAPTAEIARWSVDSARIRRPFAAETEPEDEAYLEWVK